MHAKSLALPVALSLSMLVACGKKDATPASSASASAATSTTTAVASTPATASSAAVASAAPTASSASDTLPTTVTYSPYKNAKLNYSVDVASVFTHPTAFLGPAGQEWRWGDKALMNVAAIDAKGKSIKEWHDDSKKEPGVTGSNVKDNWFFKTGKKKNKIFWQKSILKDDLLYTTRLEYDEDTKTFFDPIVSRVSSSLKVP